MDNSAKEKVVGMFNHLKDTCPEGKYGDVIATLPDYRKEAIQQIAVQCSGVAIHELVAGVETGKVADVTQRFVGAICNAITLGYLALKLDDAAVDEIARLEAMGVAEETDETIKEEGN